MTDIDAPIPSETSEPQKTLEKPFVREALEIARTVGLALLIALVLRIVLFQPFTIPSDSMEPNLLKGDYLVVSKSSYGWSRYSIPFAPPIIKDRIFERTPKRGDVVVFSQMRDGKSVDFVKRLIGLPGDRIQVTRGVVHINGEAVRQEWLGLTTDPDNPARQVMKVRETLGKKSWIVFVESPDLPAENTAEYVVPEGRYFMMGDNRDNSLDSRWPEGFGMGFVRKDTLQGRVFGVLASWKGGATWNPWTWVSRLDPSRLFHGVR